MKLALLKLGGSVVTHKDRPLSVNKKAIEDISRQLHKINKPLIIVHGGGSFGHYYSVKYGMHTKPARYDLHGVSVVRCSMVELNDHIVRIMARNGLNPYTVQPSSLLNGPRILRSSVLELNSLAKNGLIPVTHGDILHHKGSSYYILSGDALMTILTRYLKPDIAVFAVNVDGIYSDMRSRKLIRELTPDHRTEFSQVKADVTGSMGRKVKEAFKISAMGIDVMMVNGLKPDRIAKALTGRSVEGTLIRGR